MINKLKSTSGESIAETLVAVLIAAFALLMLAGSINTSSNLITQSQNKLEEYYSENNSLVMKNTESGGKVKVQPGTADITVKTDEGVTPAVSETFSTEAYYKLDSSIGNQSLITYGG